MGNPIGVVPAATTAQITHQGNTSTSPTMGIIQAYLPEMFDIGTYSHWSPLAASADLGALAGMASHSNLISSGTQTFLKAFSMGSQVLQAATGYTTQVPLLSQLFWTGSDALTFNLNLQINATYDAKAEVTSAVTSLLSLCLPSLDEGGTFRAPGPSILPAGLGGSQYNINLAIGGNWLFPNVLIQNVTASFDVLPTVKGDYISATVHVQVTTNRMYSKTDLFTAMHNNPNPGTNNSPGMIQSFLSKYGNISNDVSNFETGASAIGNKISSYF